MGYNVNTTESNFVLRSGNFEAAYSAMCRLNQRDDLKTGGCWGPSDINAKDGRPDGMDHHPAKWFSWMDANYPAKCKTVADILTDLGFEFDQDEDGIYDPQYNNKSGSEELFFEAIAPFIKDESFICWRGEDGEEYRWFFKDGKMIVQSVIHKVWG